MGRDEEIDFDLYNVFAGGYGPTEQGRFTDIPTEGISSGNPIVPEVSGVGSPVGRSRVLGIRQWEF